MRNWSKQDEAQIARLVCVGFDGTSPTAELRDLIARGVRSVIFFKRNFENASQFAELTQKVKELSDEPIMTCIDQEGGRVQRLRDGFSAIPSMRDVGQSKNPQKLAAIIGQVLARELRSVNIDLNFAPVMDVDTNPANPVIADRAFSNDPTAVGELGAIVIQKMQAGGVAACAKHFPGHGDTVVDSHKNLPALPHDLSRLNQVELPPFQKAIDAGVATIMTAHVLFQSIDPEFPSTLSPKVLNLLRDEMKFDWVIISDCLEMKAIADHYGFDEAAIQCINAGVDLMLICHTPALQNRAIDTLKNAVDSGRVPWEKILQASSAVQRLNEKYAKKPTDYSPIPPTNFGAETGKLHDPTDWK